MRSDYQVETVGELLDTGSFGGACSVNLVTASGKTITPSSFLQDYDTYFDALRTVQLRGGATMDAIRSDLENKRSGMLRFTHQNLDRYIGYLPVGIGDWVLLANVPADVVKDQAFELGRYGITLLLGVSSVLVLLLLYLGVLQKKHMSRIRENERELAAMAVTFQAACSTLCDEEYTVVYASEGVFRLIGCTREEFEQRTRTAFSVIEQPDRASLKQKMQDQMKERNFYEVEYRVAGATERLWVLTGQAVRRIDRRMVYYGVLVASQHQNCARTASRRTLPRLWKTDSVIFEWNMRTGTAQFSDGGGKSGIPPCRRISESMTAQAILHPDLRVSAPLRPDIRWGPLCGGRPSDLETAGRLCLVQGVPNCDLGQGRQALPGCRRDAQYRPGKARNAADTG
ncbi:MAG: PAS domain-containing protein [Oscillospiraceae bacterium]